MRATARCSCSTRPPAPNCTSSTVVRPPAPVLHLRCPPPQLLDRARRPAPRVRIPAVGGPRSIVWIAIRACDISQSNLAHAQANLALFSSLYGERFEYRPPRNMYYTRGGSTKGQEAAMRYLYSKVYARVPAPTPMRSGLSSPSKSVTCIYLRANRRRCPSSSTTRASASAT